jgi:hypothetical protein
LYGASGATYAWTASGGVPSASAGLALNFTPKGNSKMNYSVAIAGGGLTYTLTVSDPSLGTGVVAFQTNQAGSVIQILH